MEEELIQDGLSCLLRTGALRHTAMITMGSSILLAVLPGLIRRMRDTGHIRDLHHHMAEAKPVHDVTDDNITVFGMEAEINEKV